MFELLFILENKIGLAFVLLPFVVYAINYMHKQDKVYLLIWRILLISSVLLCIGLNVFDREKYKELQQKKEQDNITFNIVGE